MKYRSRIPNNESRIFFRGIELKSPFPDVAPFATLELEDMMIVVYTDSKGVWGNNLVTSNVCAFDHSGKILWVIQPATAVDSERPEYFVALGYDEKTGKFKASTDEGNGYELDPKTGSIIWSWYSK